MKKYLVAGLSLFCLCSLLVYYFLSKENPKTIGKKLLSSGELNIQKKEVININKVQRRPALSKDRIVESRSLNINNSKKQNSKQKIKEALRKLSSQRIEKKHTINGQEYLLQEDLVAIDKNQFKDEMGKQISESGGYIVFKPNSDMSSKAEVVRNPVNGMLGIVTGMVILVLEEGQDIQNLNTILGYKVSYSAEHLATYYLEPVEGVRVYDLAENLEEIQGVSSVRVEVIENVREAK